MVYQAIPIRRDYQTKRSGWIESTGVIALLIFGSIIWWVVVQNSQQPSFIHKTPTHRQESRDKSNKHDIVIEL